MDAWGIDDGWRGNGAGRRCGWEEKGREILGKMGVIRGGMLVRTNVQKSSKN